MELKNLVGKKVLRRKPTVSGNRSYMCSDSFIVTVVDCINEIPIVEIFDVGDKKTEVKMITGYLNDDNWFDATDVYNRIEEIKVQMILDERQKNTENNLQVS